MKKGNNKGDFEWEIKPSEGWFEINLSEVWQYRDLILRFVRRDFIASYKQTILGPFWMLINPLFTVAIFTVVFSRVVGISTDGLPPVLFYLSGIILWNYFTDCFGAAAGIFKDYAEIFNKVYFPRLAVPISAILSHMVRFGIQLLLFFCIFLFYIFTSDAVEPQISILFFPAIVVACGLLGMGMGLIVAAVSAKYRDLFNLAGFAIRLLMYVTPVIYPVSVVPEQYRFLLWFNPVSPMIESFRFVFLGKGSFDHWQLLYSLLCTAIVLVIGVLMFKKSGESVVDIL